MKKQMDKYIIYVGYLFELVMIFSYRIFNNYTSTHAIQSTSSGTPILGKMGILMNVYQTVYYLFHILAIIYIIIAIKKIIDNEPMNLIYNTLLSLGIVLIEIIDHGFTFPLISNLIISSSALRFVGVVLLTNLVIYLKYKNRILKKVV